MMCLNMFLELALSMSQLNQEKMNMTLRVKECDKLDAANKKLKAELRELKDYVAYATLSRDEMEAYKKEVDGKVWSNWYTEC